MFNIKILQRFLPLAILSITTCIAFGQTQAPIVVGDLMNYSLCAEYTHPYRNGWQMALDEINAAGGVLGRPLKVISRDYKGDPGMAVRVAEELVKRDQVVMLTGTDWDNIGLAVSSFSKRRKVLFIKGMNGTSKHIWQEGHRYAFRLDVANYTYAEIMAEEAAKLPAKRWAFVAPNYEFGRSMVADFQAALKKRRPDVEFVAMQWPTNQKLDPAPTVQALLHAKPDAIFNVTFGADISRLIRQGRDRGLFDGRRPVISVITGIPEELEPLGKEMPVGWITCGFPYEDITTPTHRAFLQRYHARYGKNPGWAAFVGYHVLKTAAAAIEKAGSLETEKLVDAMEGLTLESTIGPVTYRASDHQSTLGVWVGKTGFVKGKPTIVDWVYKPGDAYLPSPEEVKKLRPAQ